MPKSKRQKRMESQQKIQLNQTDEQKLIQGFLNRAEQIYGARSAWFIGQDSLRQIRQGQLPEKDWPWAGAANVNIPITERFIRSMASVYSEVNAIRPLAIFEPQDERGDVETSKRWERFYEFLQETQIRGRRKLRELVDQMLERGAFLKVSYETRNEWREEVIDREKELSDFDLAVILNLPKADIVNQLAVTFKMDAEDPDEFKELESAVDQFKSGKRLIKFARRVKVYDAPVWTVVKPEDVLRMPNAPKDIQKHRLFIHRFWQSKGDVRRKVREGIYRKEVLDKLAKASDRERFGSGGVEQILEERERLDFGLTMPSINDQLMEDREVETWEVYTYHSPDAEKEPEKKAVFTLFPQYHGGIFARAFYWNRPKWPWKEFDYDNPDGQTYTGRGVTHLLRDIQLEINGLHNMNLDALQLSYLPVGVYDADSLEAAHSGPMNISPGLMIPGKPGQSIEFLKPQTSQFEFLQEENVLLSYGESLLGQIQNVLQRQGSSRDSRTATEIGATQALSGRIGTYDIGRFQDDMAEVHEITFYELVENMPEETPFRYFGDNGEPLWDKVSRREAQQILMDIRPHGNLQNSNKGMEAAKWQQRFQFAIALAQAGVPVDFRRLGVMYYSADGLKEVDAILPQQQQQGGMNAQIAQAAGGVPEQVPGGAPEVPGRQAIRQPALR